jgi:hypothetical protein
MLADLTQFQAAHINSDWPSDYAEDGPRGTSDHDPQVGAYGLSPSIDGVEALLKYFVASGAITGERTERMLLQRLEWARRLEDHHMGFAANAQLRAFIHQVRASSPRFVTEAAADALVKEVEMMIERHHGPWWFWFPGCE